MFPNVRQALAKEPQRRGSLGDIKHVVLVMQENRPFDHYFGTLAGVRGFDDIEALKLSMANQFSISPMQKTRMGTYCRFTWTHMQPARKKFLPLATRGRSNMKRGMADGWLLAHRKADGEHGLYVMGYYKREDIPFQFALAEAFTVCDGYHCSVMGPTWPNRMYWMTGTIDPDGRVPWKVYQEPTGHGFSMLAHFKAFQEADKTSPLYTKGIQPISAGQFEYDALHDKLPAVSWLYPNSFQSEHPDHMPADGASFVASKIDAIAANQDVWAKTAFILNYDENDGLFDHVPPPVPPPGAPKAFISGFPIGAGFRVPWIIVSPWTMGGRVSSQPFDHTSVLQFLEKFTGVREPNITDWRRRTFGDLTSAFRFVEPGKRPPVLPDTLGTLNLAKYASVNLPKPILPGADQEVPKQEKGRRNRLSKS